MKTDTRQHIVQTFLQINKQTHICNLARRWWTPIYSTSACIILTIYYIISKKWARKTIAPSQSVPLKLSFCNWQISINENC